MKVATEAWRPDVISDLLRLYWRSEEIKRFMWARFSTAALDSSRRQRPFQNKSTGGERPQDKDKFIAPKALAAVKDGFVPRTSRPFSLESQGGDPRFARRHAHALLPLSDKETAGNQR